MNNQSPLARLKNIIFENRGPILVRFLIPMMYITIFIVSIVIYTQLHIIDKHWLNRIGGSIICISLFLSFLQFSYERWLENRLLNMKTFKPINTRLLELGFTDQEAERRASLINNSNSRKWEGMRLEIVYHTIFCVAVGELLHSFGDLILHKAEHYLGI